MPKNQMMTNSDRPERRRWEIIHGMSDKRKSVKVGGKNYRMGTQGGMTIKDEGVAREIFHKHDERGGGDGDLVVIPVETRPDPIHRRTFVVRLPKNYKG